MARNIYRLYSDYSEETIARMLAEHHERFLARRPHVRAEQERALQRAIDRDGISYQPKYGPESTLAPASTTE